MSAYGEMFLSKVIDQGDITPFAKHGIDRSHFATEGEQQAYDFVTRYAAENGGKAPSYATLTAECPDVTYIPEVTDSYEFLARKLRDNAGKRRLVELFNGRVDPKSGKTVPSDVMARFGDLDSDEFISGLIDRLENIRIETRTSVCKGTDISRDTDKFLAEYQARKEGKSFRIWKSKFPSINREIGGYLSSNMYTWYARSGRGKSVITMEEAIEAAFQGATVLVWALEMSKFEWMARAYSSISAREGVANARIDGVDYTAGFENRALLMGKLTEEFEAAFKAFVSTLNERLPGRIILRAIDDEDFRDKGLRQLEADIVEVNADVVVIDPFYYLDYEANTSRTTGGDAAATSVKLRHLAGRTKTVIHVITQAEENSSEKNVETGERELKPPKRAEIKKTMAVLEDAANTFGIDTLAHDGRGIIELGKGRSGGEDIRVELVYLPNYGIVHEISGEGTADQFVDTF